MIWRKHYRSMYEGSMVGAGALVFALMGYVISHQEHGRNTGWVVRLNPILLGAILGEKPEDVTKAIGFLCQKDGRSTSKLEEGRRLVPLAGGSMEYWVVNGDAYQGQVDYEKRLEQNRVAQERHRRKGKPTKAGAEAKYQAYMAEETVFVKAEKERAMAEDRQEGQ